MDDQIAHPPKPCVTMDFLNPQKPVLEGQAPRHPRRTPPYLSKSLPRHKKQKLAHSHEDRDIGIGHSNASLLQNASQRSVSDASASNWFDKANENVPTDHDRSPQANEDPPFFLGAQQHTLPDNLVSSCSDELFGAEEQDENENENENDDLRGVIDDLTVENKRLKRLLKSHRPTTNPNTEAKDRLFELRVHGLSAEKKRELELLLRSFTASANRPSSTSSPSATYGSRITVGDTGSNPAWNVAPQQRTKLPPTDSGYGSNSRSGANSTAVSSGGKSAVPVSRSNRNKNIKSYLHDIPDSLLPRQAPFMSERAKQVLVVRRLEQLFTGKQAAPGVHSQPIQQQEVSHSAEKAEAPSHRRTLHEGTREAHILPHDTKGSLHVVDRLNQSPPKLQKSSSGDSEASDASTSNPTQPGSPEQRPTRPLDLDIHRAQVASDNIEYIRHLGLSTPHIHQGTAKKDPSWIYLNLLIGMAQLHTLHVTPAFIQKAIKKLSTKFELSPDGKQVRWKGGSEGTTLPIFEDRAAEESDQTSTELIDDRSGSSSKRSKTYSSSNNLISEESFPEDKFDALEPSNTSLPRESTSVTSNLQTTSVNPGSKATSAFEYKPQFYKGKQCSAAASYLESTSSSSPSDESGDLVRMFSNSNLNQRRGSDEGVITFYSNPFFCSDGSADKSPINWKPQRPLMPGEGLGVKQEDSTESPLRYCDACYFTPQFAPQPFSGILTEADLSWNMSKVSASGKDETQPMEMEASGIGGVWPEDNFAVDVKVLRQVRNSGDDSKPSVVPLTGSRKRKRYSYSTANCETLELQPSKLPPPSYVFFASSSSSANPDMEDSASESSSSADEEDPAPALFLNKWSTGSSDGGSDEKEDDESRSVDMLALARAADRDRIAEQEREYVLTHPPRIEGSLAATVGASRSSSDVEEEEEDAQDGISDMSVDGEVSDED